MVNNDDKLKQRPAGDSRGIARDGDVQNSGVQAGDYQGNRMNGGEAQGNIASGVVSADTGKSPPERRKMPLFVIVLLAATFIIVMFAFIFEARTGRAPLSSGKSGQMTASQIQNEIDDLSWITQEFLPLNPFSRPGTLLEEVNTIVIHNIGNPGTTALQNRNYFANLANTQETHASSNFIVCLDGTVIQCVPVDEIAYASNERNADSISIEVCHPDDTGRFTDESYAATVRLTAWLCDRFGIDPNDIIRHYDVRGKECPRYFVVNEDAWEAFKADIGRALMNN